MATHTHTYILGSKKQLVMLVWHWNIMGFFEGFVWLFDHIKNETDNLFSLKEHIASHFLVFISWIKIGEISHEHEVQSNKYVTDTYFWYVWLPWEQEKKKINLIEGCLSLGKVTWKESTEQYPCTLILFSEPIWRIQKIRRSLSAKIWKKVNQFFKVFLLHS